MKRCDESVNPDLLTPSHAARILEVVPATVVYLARTGRLATIRTSSGLRLFRRGEVEALAAERARRRNGGSAR